MIVDLFEAVTFDMFRWQCIWPILYATRDERQFGFHDCDGRSFVVEH